MLGGKPDAFVDVSLAPGSHKEMRTKYNTQKKTFFIILSVIFRTIKNNSNPAFQEEFIFNGALDEVCKNTKRQFVDT